MLGEGTSSRGGFRNRNEAGDALAVRLMQYAGRNDVVVLALPRGGVPVAARVATALKAPLDVFLVRKLGVPGHEELAMGAIASGGVSVLNNHVVAMLGIDNETIDEVTAEERLELERREKAYRGNRPPVAIPDRVVILIDDGIATGASMRAAVKAARAGAPTRIIVAVPVAPPDTVAALQRDADEVVCLMTPEPFMAVGLWYDDFSQTTDKEVQELLHQ